MTEQVIKLRVFVASPGDVQKERELLGNVIGELNRGIAGEKGLVLELVRWETHAWPDIGEDAQDVINRQIAPGDVFVGIMWNRFGTPTKRAESGTKEEFDRAYAYWKQYGRPKIMFYFNLAPFSPSSMDELEQKGKILTFKEELGDKGALYWEYNGANEFERVVREHLTQVVRQWEPESKEPYKKRRRIDAAAPSYAEVGQRIDLLVQVRFPDSPLLGIKDWPTKQKPSSIEQASEPVALEFPVDPRTGKLGSARLEIRVVAPDFAIEGAAQQIVEVPPDQYSQRIAFLLTAKKAGICRIDVGVYSADHIYLGTIPVETTIGGMVATPTAIVNNLFLVVMVGREHVVTVTGSGAVAVGERAVAAGEGGVAVGGDVVYGDKVGGDKVAGDKVEVSTHVRDVHGGTVITAGRDVTYTAGAGGDDPALLEASYLRRVQVSCNALPLATIDPQAMERTRQQTMDLLAVYVALDTQTPVAVEEVKGKRLQRKEELLTWLLGEGPVETLTALEATARERQMVLLGDPGSGKSTFANYLALCLAGARLERSGKTSALPGDEWLAHLKPAWIHGPLLPLQVTLRHFARSNWCNGTAAGLWNFVEDTLAAQGLASFSPYLRRQLLDGGVMVLLDGLDEVADPEERKAVRNTVTDFAATYGHPTNRYLVTCRGYAYQDPRSQLERFAAHTLAPFNQKQIDEFIGCWYKEVCRLGWKNEIEAEDLTHRLQAATRRPDLAPLARSPLQLTMMASLHFSWGRLPEDRAKLYQQMVELLLVRWQEARLGEEVSVTQAVSADKLESALEQVAFVAHRAQEGPEGTADVGEVVLRSVLKDYLEGSWDRAGELAAYIRERAGLLIERGPGVYTFPHRSYQEYLAGSHLAVQPDFPDQAASLIRENYAQWREVVLWAVGVMARLKKMIHVAVDVAAALCPREVPDQAVSEADWRSAYLAGEVLLEIGLEGVKARERHERVLARVQGWLMALIKRGALTPAERAAAGNVLARLGDPRPGVGLREDGLPDVVWCEVPAGPFIMGTRKEEIPALKERFGEYEWYEYEWEMPQHRLDLLAYSISKYPVTNAQFQAFVEAGGYRERQYWVEAEAAQFWQDGMIKHIFPRTIKEGEIEWIEGIANTPKDLGEPFNLSNHPVVGATWYEAVAFCHWLTERLQETGEIGLDQEVTLPSEAQWEKAARGDDGRIFPWGSEFDAAKCNVYETGIGVTSAVGMFPAGASPYGVQDMGGNTLEWCRTKWRDNYKEPADESLEGMSLRVLRDGAYYLNRGVARCAVRNRIAPDVSYSFSFRICLVSQQD